MSATNFVIQPSGRIHRATCKRVAEQDFTTLKDAPTALVAGAILASCCKPKAAQVYIDAAKAEEPWPNAAESVQGIAPEGQTVQDVIVEQATEQPVILGPEAGENEGIELLFDSTKAPEQPAEDDLIGEVPVAKAAPAELAGTKISKHYHDALIKVGGPLLHGTRDSLAEVATEAFAALGKWRRADADYKALPAQDSKWVTSDRYAWERDFLIGYIQQVVGQRPKATYAKEGTLAARRGAAAAKADRS